MNTGHRTIKIAVALLLAMHTAGALAQHVAETSPRAGELRFNRFQYKASHNSFERSEKLSEQVDDYNVWCVELDLKWDRDSDDNREIKVEHFCDSAHNAQTLNWELDELSGSVTAARKVTCIYLQFSNASNGHCYDSWNQTAVDAALLMIQQSLEDELGADTIYPVSEWIDTDQQKWPSSQELVRRGYNWFVVVGRGGIDDIVMDGHSVFFTETVVSNWNSFFYADERAMANLDGGHDGNVEQHTLDAHGDRWLSRVYPDTSNAELTNGGYWDDALDNDFTFVATNDISDEGSVTDTRTHSPVPLHVHFGSDASSKWGTVRYPMNDLDDAFDRVSYGALIAISSVDAGSEITIDVQNNIVFDTPCVLTALNRPVILK